MKERCIDDSRLMSVLGVVAFVTLFLVVGTATAQAADEGQQTVVNGCMQEVAGRNLNCTANDVRLSTVTNVAITDPCDFPGDMVTFSADFETVLTAQERHDIGIYFSVDGDVDNPNTAINEAGDGALTGFCSISTLNYKDDPPWLDLNGTNDNYAGTKIKSNIQDTCGDIDSAHNPLFPNITVTAVCADDDGDGFLDLPYCTSWRQPGSNELCTGPLPTGTKGTVGATSGVFPGSPSKCKCDAGFNVPVPVPPGTITVIKGAVNGNDNVATVPEPGGNVVFDVEVVNDSPDPATMVTINTLSDNLYGDITQVQGDVVATDCSVPQTIAGSSSYMCSFTAYVSGNVGDVVIDTVSASGVDDRTPPNPVSDSDQANVDFSDVAPTIDLIKGALEGNDNVGSVDEPGGSIVFAVSVENTSVSTDTVTLNSLSDDVYGDITVVAGDITATACSVPQTIVSGAFYTCSFTADVNGNGNTNQVDTLTASATDDEGGTATDSDQANVDINDVPPAASLTKTATMVVVTYEVVVYNDSTAESLSLDSLIDDKFGDITSVQGDVLTTTCAVPQTLAINDSYTCSFDGKVSTSPHTNEVTGTVSDDDGGSVTPSDTATVTFE